MVHGTGEGASLGQNDRQRALGALVGAAVDPRSQLVVGIAAASVEDAIAQGRAGLMLGCPSFLLAPPFYFKGCGDEGLFDWMSRALQYGCSGHRQSEQPAALMCSIDIAGGRNRTWTCPAIKSVSAGPPPR